MNFKRWEGLLFVILLFEFEQIEMFAFKFDFEFQVIRFETVTLKKNMMLFKMSVKKKNGKVC